MSTSPKIVQIIPGQLPSQYLALGDNGELYHAVLHPDDRFYHFKGNQTIEGWKMISTSLPDYD